MLVHSVRTALGELAGGSIFETNFENAFENPLDTCTMTDSLCPSGGLCDSVSGYQTRESLQP